MRKLIIRLVAVVLVILLGIFLYDIGRMHTFLPENKTIELNGTEYKYYASITFTIDGLEEEELYPRDRVLSQVSGRSHKITVTGISRSGEEISVEKKFRISHKVDSYLLNLPALLGGDSDWITEFVPLN